jgi:homoserine kinase
MPLRKVTVRVPATSGNLGPGFDCLGVALDSYARVTLERSETDRVEIRGYGARDLSRGKDNLVVRSIDALYAHLGKSAPPLTVRCSNTVPLNRGLGSSAAAVVGGLVAANALEGSEVPQGELLELAARLEGHPDNVTPALLGGMHVVTSNEGRLVTEQVQVKRGLRAVIFIPDIELPTHQARIVLATRVSREDAIYNISRASLLILALSKGRWDLLATATQDRLHQPARSQLFPAMNSLFQAALSAGALGAFLSGAGPTVLALASGETAPIERAMGDAARAAGVTGSAKSLAFAARGAHAVRTA